MSARALVIQPDADCPPAQVADWARAAGVELDVRRPYAEEPLPSSLAEHDGLVVLGGAMGAYESARFPWLTHIEQLIADAVLRDVPFLGICLGHQLAAIALGGTVTLRSSGPGTGVWPLIATDELASDPVFAHTPPQTHTVVWNHDVVDVLPTGAVVLARDADDFPSLVRLAPRAWGTQFHPEVTAEVFAVWASAAPTPPSIGGPARVAEIVAEVGAALPAIDTTWRPAMTAFFAQVTR